MTPPVIDAPARERIRSAVDESLLIEAGAGTGKTTVLVARIVELIRSGVATVDQLVVITFTEKAASELGARVREELESAAAVTQDAEARVRLTAGLHSLYRARIETIHAFAMSLLRERPVESPVDPGLRVLDEVEASVLFSDVYDVWLDELLSRQSDELRRAVRRGFDTSHLRRLAEILHEHRSALPIKPSTSSSPDPIAFLDAIGGAADALRSELAACTDHGDRGFEQAERLIDWTAQLDRVSGDELEVERRALFRPPKISARAGNKQNWASDDSLAAVRTAAESLDDAIATFADSLRGEVLEDMVPQVEEFVTRYADRRRADGVADFDDLLVWARDLLRNPEVRRYFNQRYPCVLVDEFQDTDPVQVELTLLLTDIDGDGSPEPGRLVAVGDPKQSIYRFRRADIAMYDDVKHGSMRDGLVQIQQNFRSVPGVLDWVNKVFASNFGAGVVGMQPPHVPLVPFRSGGDRAPVVVVHGDGTATKADAIRIQEAALVAATFSLAVRDEGWTLRDVATGAERPASWRDCVILLPTRTGIEHYASSLEDRGIPYRSETRGQFFASAEVVELIGLIRAIDDPSDALSIVATLRSRAFGCSDDDLLRYSVAAGGRFDYRRVATSGTASVVEALEVMSDLHRQRRGLSNAELVRRAIEVTGLVELALARQDGAQVAANILKVVDLARAFTVSGGGGLRAFTRWLATQQDEEAGEAEASVSEEADDVVRVMTIHAAKGLEFPIVALANANASLRAPEGPFSDPAAHCVAFRVGTARAGRFATADFESWVEREKQQLEAERLRLLYVALTRARDHLLIPCVPPAEKRVGMLAVLAPHLPPLDDETRGSEVDGVHVLDPDSLPATTTVGSAPVPRLDETETAAAVVELEAWSAARASAIDEAAIGRSVLTASSVRPFDRVFPLAATTDAGDAAISLGLAPPVDIGSAVHRVLELAPLAPGPELETIARAVCDEAGIAPALPEVVELARRCVESPSVQRALRSDGWKREIPFAAVLEDGMQLVGRMDLLFLEDDELVVVDFKTDDVCTPEEVDAATIAHSGQAAAYALAAERATGFSVREVVFVYARPGAERTLPRTELPAELVS